MLILSPHDTSESEDRSARQCHCIQTIIFSYRIRVISEITLAFHWQTCQNWTQYFPLFSAFITKKTSCLKYGKCFASLICNCFDKKIVFYFYVTQQNATAVISQSSGLCHKIVVLHVVNDERLIFGHAFDWNWSIFTKCEEIRSMARSTEEGN